jgi:hypothetical protein
MFTRSTHIANASQRTIWASVDYGINGRLNAGFIRIPPGECQRFEYPFLRLKIYISIDVEEDDGTKERVINLLERGGGTSVIVQPSFTMVDSQSGNVWNPK